MGAIGLTTEQMAMLLGCTPSEVTAHYAREVEHGLAAITAEVAASLVAAARAGDVQAQRYWLEVRAKWKAPVTVVHTHLLEADQRKALVDSLLNLVNVSPGSEGQEPKPPATHLAAPGRTQ
jgi:hypothetical protein